MKKNPFLFAILLLVLVLFLGLVLFALGAADYATARTLMDQLSRDGEMVSFTAEKHAVLRLPMLTVGISLSLLGGLGLVFFHRTEVFIRWLQHWLRRFWRRLLDDAKALWGKLTHIQFEWWEWVLVVLFVILAAAGRWVWMEKPMQHDESYTFIAFAQRPLLKLITDYSLPNNHVFNSICIHVLYQIFGNPSPVIVRFPSFLAGVLLIPLAYLWARMTYGRPAALLAASLIAVLPWLKVQSTNGRGYMIMAACTVVLFGLGELARRTKNRGVWVLLVVVTAVSFYTLPITMYPMGILGVWLLFSALVGDISQEYDGFWQFTGYLVVYGAVSGGLTFILYSPILFFGSGWNSFFNNPFVEALDWSAFWQTLPLRLVETWQEWTFDLPVWIAWLLAAGVVLSVALHWKAQKNKIPLQIAAMIALELIFVVQRPNAWSRTWTYLLPLVLTWAAAGWVMLTKVVFSTKWFDRSKVKQPLPVVLLAASLLAIFLLGSIHLAKNLQYVRGEIGQEESVTLALAKCIADDDMVLTSINYGPAFWYYFDRYGLPMNTIINLREHTGWQRVFFVVDSRENESYVALMPGTPISEEDCPGDRVTEAFMYGNYTVSVCSREGDLEDACFGK